MDYKKLSAKKIFLDRDRDGIVDTLDLQLFLSPSCSHPTILSAVMDLAACLGFETMGMDLPLARASEKRNSFHHRLHIGMDDELKDIHSKKREGDHFLRGEDENSLAKSIRDFGFSLISRMASLHEGFSTEKDRRREGFDLLNPFSSQGFYWGSSKMSLPLIFHYKILLFSHLGLDTAVEAVNFAARLGLETLSLSLPFTFPLDKVVKGGHNFVYIGKKEDLKKIGLQRNGDIFEPGWRSGIFLLPSKEKAPDVLICGEEKGLGEMLKYLSRIPMSSRGVEDPVFDSIKRFSQELKEFILGKGASKRMVAPEKIAIEYTIADEEQEIIRLLRGGLRSWRFKPNSIEVQIFLTRPEPVRKKFEVEIQEWLRRFGVPEEESVVTVLNAHKPGLSWIREVVLEEIGGIKIDRIEIAFKEFRSKGLEEPIRWLQEICPIDEILSADLSIPKEKIEFKKDSRIKEVYRICAWQKGRIVYEKHFSPKWNSQPYLFSFPRAGKIYPSTGWVTMTVDGKEVVNQRMKTGIERVWEIYQKEVLSLIEKEANQVLSKRRFLSPGPIFQELRFDIYFNYPMESLEVDEERVSPLEALHEDLYFVTLDFFSKLMKRKGIKHLSAGRIVPVIHPNFRGQNGRLKFTLVHQPEGSSPTSQKIGDVRISPNGITFNQSEVGIDFFIETENKGNYGWLRERLKSYRRAKDGPYRVKKIIEESHSGKRSFRLITFGTNFPRTKRFLKGREERIPIEIPPIEIPPIEIPMTRPIGYREGVRLVNSLQGLAGVNARQEGNSSGGLPIFSIENTYPNPSAFVSHAKRIVFRPTLFINCRHHANEVSSTNAGLKLSHLLATRPGLHKLLKKVNVVINPMENVDGMVILEEMLKLTPTDKLHAGRYNQAGQEYYLEYFNPETTFGEAKVKPAIYQRWLPDVCVDNHGFPSHEWEQPFSGYSPFRFRDFWIPRALVYLYLPHIEEKGKSSRRINTEVLGSWIAKSVSRNKAIAKWNHSFSERYSKYRGKWYEGFSRSKEGIQCLPLQRKFRRTNYSYLYPYLTAIDFVTEVADETGQGEFLKACISAHLESNLAIIKLLNYLDFNVKKIYLFKNKEPNFIWYRGRPLNLKRVK